MARQGPYRDSSYIALVGVPTVPGSISAAPPSYTDGNEGAISLDLNGNTRVIVLNTSASPVVVLPLTGIADTLQVAASAVAPGAGAAVATLAVVAGTYDVTVLAAYGTTPDVINNMVFKNNGVNVGGPLFVQAVANGQPTPQRFQRLTVAGAVNLTVNAVAAGGAGTIFNAAIFATRIQ